MQHHATRLRSTNFYLLSFLYGCLLQVCTNFNVEINHFSSHELNFRPQIPGNKIICSRKEAWYIKVRYFRSNYSCNFPPPKCHHMSLMDFVVSPPGCGRSVTDFLGWDAHEAQLRCLDEVDGDI
jgi:hypothetical protein